MSIFKKKNIDMTQGSITKGLVLYAIPIILSDFLQQLYNSVDSIIVGNMVGKQALAAVGETFFITNMFLGCFLGISLGSTVMISRAYGAKDSKKMASATNTVLRLTLILCVVFTVVGVALVPYLLKLVGTADDVWADAKTYLTIYLAGIAAQLIYNMLASLLKAVGDSQRPLYVLAFTASLNVVLDLTMVGVLKMGVAGAALATIISQGVSCIILWWLINKSPIFEKPVFRKEKMDGATLKGVFKVGLPYSIQRTITSFSNTVVISYVNFFGSTVMAGWSVYQKIDQFVISTIISISSGVTTFVAQNMGAKKPERIRKGVITALGLALGVSVIYAAFFFVFRYQVAALFSNDSEVIAFAAMMFAIMITVHITNAIPQIFAGALRGLGSSTIPTVIMLFCYVLCRQIYLKVLWPSKQTVMLVIASYHFTWTLCAIIMTGFYIFFIRKLYKK